MCLFLLAFPLRKGGTAKAVTDEVAREERKNVRQRPLISRPDGLTASPEGELDKVCRFTITGDKSKPILSCRKKFVSAKDCIPRNVKYLWKNFIKNAKIRLILLRCYFIMTLIHHVGAD